MAKALRELSGPKFAMRCVRPKGKSVVPLKFLERAQTFLISTINRHYRKHQSPWDLREYDIADISIHFKYKSQYRAGPV